MIEAALLCLVVGISDGDTVKVRCPHQAQTAVRLAEIDAPEKAQPFGQRSKQLLSTLCFMKQAQIRPAGRDRYGRTIARVTCAGTDANAAMVRAGLAWAYTRYLNDPKIQALELVARRERLGLWVDPHPLPPWEWRKAGEKGTGVRPGISAFRSDSVPPRQLALAGCYFVALREASISAAWVLLKVRKAAIAGRWLARGRAVPASQL